MRLDDTGSAVPNVYKASMEELIFEDGINVNMRQRCIRYGGLVEFG